MMTQLEMIFNAMPKGERGIDWEGLEKTYLNDYFVKMAETQQNPYYHGEGDVYTHTKMATEALVCDEEYLSLSQRDKEIMFLAVLLHDIAKPKKTKIIDGKITSHYHAPQGALLARKLLWRDLGLSGSAEKQDMRETICTLIRHHSFPPYAMECENPEERIYKIASQGALSPSFSMRKLCMLERADVKGRISNTLDSSLEKVAFCRMLSEELGCLDTPPKFKSDYAFRAYMKGKKITTDQELFDDTWGEVIMLAGLPGTGKDTFIKKVYPDLPMISLDNIREEMNISPTDKQAPVVELARERCTQLLREKTPFIWNATSLTDQLRVMQINHFEAYGAKVKIIFVETEWEEQLRRNNSRKRCVPHAIIDSMLSRLEPPQRHEAESVEWIIL